MKRENINKLKNAMDYLYSIFFNTDINLAGSAVEMGTQTFLKSYDVPYANYVAKLLLQHGFVKLDGTKREPLLYYALKQKVSYDQCNSLLIDAHNESKAAGQKSANKAGPFRENTIHTKIRIRIQDADNTIQELSDKTLKNLELICNAEKLIESLKNENNVHFEEINKVTYLLNNLKTLIE